MPSKFYHLLFILLFSFFILSCDANLDIKPSQEIDEGTALDNDANIKRVLVGAYANLRKSDLWGGRLLLYSEMLGANNEVRWTGSFTQPREMLNKSLLTNNTFVTDTWTVANATINITNNILEAIPKVNEIDQDKVKGEALFIRAVVYFELVKLFSQPYIAGNTSVNPGVPLILSPSRGEENNGIVERYPVEDIYKQIIDDLTVAEQILPDTNGVFASSYTASAMLSRVFLQMGDFASARDAANRSINLALSFDKKLMSNYADAFNNESDSQEDIFTIQVNSQDSENAMHLFYSTPEFGGRDGDVSILNSHLDLYEAGDDRLQLFQERAGALRTDKWRDPNRNVKIIRLAELYLTRAEANFREGTSLGATPLEDLNRIRRRVSLPEKSSITIENILKERKLELAHEGHILHDIKRTQGFVIDNNNPALTYAFDDPKLVFPIPEREILANSKLIQNPGY
ncbi:RagB/SusD family nutrient uptake outer membrane protein [Cyclobacterium marinum]|uniref:RagB/SusD family nutrient uptake outer membrane protein n=1 Tax=Cyclobacterium marinum TaxID=104 RepID=UPI0011EF3250|nr:RagB/SusD family nutrient uptake outer membrane protein [Cyclobacterium marinum]MBI0399851.1 RagB/SusD family nutrient uptake outer membrane protein [Cyclobacterium marinum]|tara:strand:+ start:40011 stop:41384 length:1374 start_codon:yes stop_codon:yes gene_type:complete